MSNEELIAEARATEWTLVDGDDPALEVRLADALEAAESALTAALTREAGLNAQLAKVRAARADHPQCDRHEDDSPVSCGWKSAVLDIDAALATVPTAALTKRDAEKWSEGHAAALHGVAWPKESKPNPYREEATRG